MMRGRQALLLLVVAAGLPACAEMKQRLRSLEGQPIPPPQAYWDQSVFEGEYQRVLALPLLDDSGQAGSTEVVTSAIRDELLKLRRFEVVTPNPSDASLMTEAGPKRTGRIDVGSLVDLGRRYGVDAVLFGAIDHYRAYEPPALGMSLSLVEIGSGRILWHVRDFVDGADHDTALAMRYYFEDQAAERDLVFDHDVMSAAPSWFAHFAARRVARTLEPPPPAPAPAGT